jgi:hypothetical protein
MHDPRRTLLLRSLAFAFFATTAMAVFSYLPAVGPAAVGDGFGRLTRIAGATALFAGFEATRMLSSSG